MYEFTGMIHESTLTARKEGQVLINVVRGTRRRVVDVLMNGKLRRATPDVFCAG